MSVLEKIATRPTALLVPHSELETLLEKEITENCHRKVTKRLALQLAQAVLQDDNNGMFFAEKIVHRLLVRLRKEIVLRELYIDRPVRR